MRILSRYIVSLYLRIFSLCIGSFVAIYLVIDFLEKIRRFSRYQAEFRHIAAFFLYRIPDIVTQVTPLAALMATLLTLGILSRTSEITAMRSCGISIRHIAAPILGTCFILSVLTLISNEFIVPAANEKMAYTDEILIQKKNYSTFFRQNNIWYREKNYILQAKLFEPSKKSFSGVTLWQLDANMQPVKRIDAEQGIFSDHQLMLKRGVERVIQKGDIIRTTFRQEMPFSLGLKPDDLKSVDMFADAMGYRQLRKYVKKLQRSGYDATPYKAQMHAKLALPFESLVMGFLGIPFALRSGRSSGIGMGIGISLTLGFVYFMTNYMLQALGTGGVLPAVVAAWAANVLFAAAGIWLAMTVNN